MHLPKVHCYRAAPLRIECCKRRLAALNVRHEHHEFGVGESTVAVRIEGLAQGEERGVLNVDALSLEDDLELGDGELALLGSA